MLRGDEDVSGISISELNLPAGPNWYAESAVMAGDPTTTDIALGGESCISGLVTSEAAFAVRLCIGCSHLNCGGAADCVDV